MTPSGNEPLTDEKSFLYHVNLQDLLYLLTFEDIVFIFVNGMKMYEL